MAEHPTGCELYPTVLSHALPDVTCALHNISKGDNQHPAVYVLYPAGCKLCPAVFPHIRPDIRESHICLMPNDFSITLPIPMGTVAMRHTSRLPECNAE